LQNGTEIIAVNELLLRDAFGAHAAAIADALRDEPYLEFAVLVGSRATGHTHAASDWDIALQWSHQFEWLAVLAQTETLRHRLALVLNVAPDAVDLIELRRSNLAMRASVAEEGVPLAGGDSVAWARFLRRTWRELEDFYWDQQHAA
jgi:predicted nucleotidyltransferase